MNLVIVCVKFFVTLLLKASLLAVKLCWNSQVTGTFFSCIKYFSRNELVFVH